jgi:cobalamin biosynthesis protein CobW
MAVPVLLVAGFLGAGKTTLVNRLLTNPDGRRIAAIVNDFGAVDIDAALLAEVSDDVVSLKNGCICCTLQGDLLRSLATVMRRDVPPDLIVIETSGVSDPAEIVRSLLDPVIFKVAALDTVVTLVDAAELAERDDLLRDSLWLSQVRAGDFVIFNKLDLVEPETRARLRDELHRLKPGRAIFEAVRSDVPREVLVSGGGYQATLPSATRPVISSPQFESVSWISSKPLTMRGFQVAVQFLATRILRAKGILTFQEKLGEPMQFQLVGKRATVTPCAAALGNSLLNEGLAAKIVVIYSGMETASTDIIAALEQAT